jgi:hypothetical protein
MSLAEYSFILFNERRGGKTWAIMDEIHELAVQNRTAEVLVLVPSAQQREWWIREWRSRFQALTCPRVESIQSPVGVRGRRFEKIYIEDIDMSDDGIYDRKLWDVWPCLAWAREPEVTFTCSPLPFAYESLVEQDKRHAREREEAKRRAVETRQARRRFMDSVIMKYIANTGEMPRLPDHMMNGSER